MGGKDTARTAQGVGSRDSPDERTRVAGCMCRPRYGHLYVPPYFTGTCGQDGLPDLRIPVGNQSGRTFYQWNPNHRPTLHDLIRRLDGGMHEVSHTFWTYENTRTMQPLQKVCKEYDNLIQTYLSKIYIEELESPALSRQSRFRLPQATPQVTGETGTGLL